jgi:dynein assembly factor with WDR repeat domains 1
MRLKRFLLRYYPPGMIEIKKILIYELIIGIILEYEQSNVLKTKSIDLLDLRPE